MAEESAVSKAASVLTQARKPLLIIGKGNPLCALLLTIKQSESFYCLDVQSIRKVNFFFKFGVQITSQKILSSDENIMISF